MNTINVSIARFPGVVKNILVAPGTTIREAARLAEISLTANDTVRLDGNAATLDTPLRCSQNSVVITAQVKGN